VGDHRQSVAVLQLVQARDTDAGQVDGVGVSHVFPIWASGNCRFTEPSNTTESLLLCPTVV
jgi:hypothetical protein